MESLIASAWKTIHQANLIKKYNFLPSLFSTIVLAGIALYQVSITWVMLAHKQDVVFEWIADITKTWIFWESLLGGFLVFIIMETIIAIYEGGLLFLIRAFADQDREKYSYLRGLGAGIRAFVPIFEYNVATKIFHPLTLLTTYFLLLRIIGMEFFWIVTAGMAIYATIALVINVFLSYARFFIVFEKKSVSAAISATIAMSLDHMETTVRLFVSLFLLYVRTLLVLLAILLFPLGITALFTWLGASVAFWIAAVFGMIAFIGFLGFVAHVNSVLEIFITSLWFHAWQTHSGGGGGEEDDHH